MEKNKEDIKTMIEKQSTLFKKQCKEKLDRLYPEVEQFYKDNLQDKDIFFIKILASILYGRIEQYLRDKLINLEQYILSTNKQDETTD